MVDVLLIEDNADDAQLIQRQLALAGADYKVTIVSERDAVEAALDRHFDVCLLDFFLPGYNGLELLQDISVEELPGPVILLTGAHDERLDAAALECGIADFLTKDEAASAVLDRSIRYARHQHASRQTLRYQSRHDDLTGLLNRPIFMQRLEALIAHPETDLDTTHLAYLDIDGLKTINDNWGHDTGDRVLRHAAARLHTTLSELADSGAFVAEPLVARFGGGVLAAALRCDAETPIARIAERMVDAMREPVAGGGARIVATASIGIACANQAPGNVHDLVRLADQAMYSAKHAGRDTYWCHEGGGESYTRLRATLETDLRQAIADQALYQIYEPQIALSSGALIGAEALARWVHPTLGNVAPNTFMPIAHVCGLIRPLTHWSLSAALQSLAHWQPNLPSGFRLAVNIAPAQLLAPGFVENLGQMLTEHGVSPQHLRLEITENFFTYEQATSKLQALGEMGLSLALDDFGTGYSSLARLSRLPIDTLKIDLSFVHQMVRNTRSAALAKTIVSIGKDLGMTVIAEGIETQDQADMLQGFGCEGAQGFLYSRGDDQASFSQRLRALAGE